MKTTRQLAWTTGAVAFVAGFAIAYPLLPRRQVLTWGATKEESTRGMAGDELLVKPDLVTTRAITVDAAPAQIWPWLAQLGPDRGGMYSYDRLEKLVGLEVHSANEIVPGLQELNVGDTIALVKGPALRVELLQPEQALVLRSTDHRWVWAFELRPDAKQTRLISRNSIALPRLPMPARAMAHLLLEPAGLLMERKMLLGIKQRVEAHRTG
jgi:hypothetical protein